MVKKYNYYDTPGSDPDTKKYRGWETAILIFGIGVVSTMLLISHFFGKSAKPTYKQYITTQEAEYVEAIPPTPAQLVCEPVAIDRTDDTDRLISLVSYSGLPIAHVSVTEYGEMCDDGIREPVYDVETDIMVVVDVLNEAIKPDYRKLGNHISTLLPSMMQIRPQQPRNVIIQFLTYDTYIEWVQSYQSINRMTEQLRGDDLWFWTPPQY